MPKILLTDKLITNDLICPANKARIELCDTRVPGMYVEVRSTSPGIGTYYLRYKDISGKTCHIKIGRTTDVTLKQARERARNLPLRDSSRGNANARSRARLCVGLEWCGWARVDHVGVA